ncbi:MAG: TIGR00282 family metallophosphoesterase [Sumerlaeia bacterium]
MNILFIGDIFGQPGRVAVKKLVPELRRRYEAEFVIANAENAAHGKGVTAKIVAELLDCGIDCLTGGNHSFAVQKSEEVHDREVRLLRPANMPPGTPGHGAGIYDSAAGFRVGVANVCGRAFMAHYDDPFREAAALVKDLRRDTPIVILDFHAETTSEKVGMGWFLDGKCSAVLGTHTHIPTADETILPEGTGYITDAGMTGPYRSIIGGEIEPILYTMRTLQRRRFGVAEPKDVRLCGVFLEVDPLTGETRRIERIREDLGDLTTEL